VPRANESLFDRVCRDDKNRHLVIHFENHSYIPAAFCLAIYDESFTEVRWFVAGHNPLTFISTYAMVADRGLVLIDRAEVVPRQ